jgi:hypothetical protein
MRVGLRQARIGDINANYFSVIGSDPHRLDGDSDGIGCET